MKLAEAHAHASCTKTARDVQRLHTLNFSLILYPQHPATLFADINVETTRSQPPTPDPCTHATCPCSNNQPTVTIPVLVTTIVIIITMIVTTILLLLLLLLILSLLILLFLLLFLLLLLLLLLILLLPYARAPPSGHAMANKVELLALPVGPWLALKHGDGFRV